MNRSVFIIIILFVFLSLTCSCSRTLSQRNKPGPDGTGWQTLEPSVDPYAKFRPEAATQNPTPSSTPAPSPTPSPEPTPSLTPSPASTPSPTPSPEPTPSPTPSSEPTPSPTPSPAPTPSPTPSPAPTPSPTPDPTPTPYNQPEQPLPANGYSNILDGGEAIAPLSVKTPDDGHYYYVVLKDYDTRAKKLVLFVYPDSLAETNIPLGDYLLFYATGSKWYGEEYLFGPETSYFKSDSKLSFYISGEYAMGHSVELIKQTGGNMPTQDISESDFLD